MAQEGAQTITHSARHILRCAVKKDQEQVAEKAIF
jgi:hypothetical protein